MTAANEYSYGGTDNIEAMEDAVNYNAFLLNLVRERVRPGMRVVDFGAGIGTFAAALSRLGVSVSCVEPDPNHAEKITRLGLEVFHDLTSFADESVDLLYCLNVIEHVEDDKAVLRLIQRKIAVGGEVVIYVPAFQILYSSMDRKVGHFRRYGKRQLERMATDSGFTVAECRHVDSAGFFLTLLFKLLGNDSGDINRRALIVFDRLVFPISQIADRFLSSQVGKNLLLVGRRPDSISNGR